MDSDACTKENAKIIRREGLGEAGTTNALAFSRVVFPKSDSGYPKKNVEEKNKI